MEDRIFSFPDHQSSKWVEQNDAQVGFSELQIVDDKIYVPIHIYEDSLVDWDIEPSHVLDRILRPFVYPRSLLDAIQEQRVASYHLCHWYDQVVDVIPTAQSLVLPCDNRYDVSSYLNYHLKGQTMFVRLCSMSPKDLCLPLCTTSEEAWNLLTTSQRTQHRLDNPCHLVLRQPKSFLWEARCFWSRDKLRAVSLSQDSEEIQKSILDFFTRYGQDLPYHSAVVDIGMTSRRLELIEFNSFGPDLNATSGNFSWLEDINILLNSQEPVFRSSNGFSFT